MVRYSAMETYLTGSCHFSNLLHVCGDSFHALWSPGVSGVEMKIYERSLQALLSLAQIGELARRLGVSKFLQLVVQVLHTYSHCVDLLN